jgi:uncharacterized protein YndB with AHSA1/START domain
MKPTIDSTSTEEPVVTMTRVFDAPREMVWEALTRPEHVAQWFGGHGFSSPVCEMDLRPGGVWRHVMRAPDGSEFPVNSVFVEVVEPERLVWKSHRKVSATETSEVVHTTTLENLDGKTRWTLVARFASFADRDISVKMGFANMVGQGVERLGEFIEKR